jgi:hypothetical protein
MDLGVKLRKKSAWSIETAKLYLRDKNQLNRKVQGQGLVLEPTLTLLKDKLAIILVKDRGKWVKMELQMASKGILSRSHKAVNKNKVSFFKTY